MPAGNVVARPAGRVRYIVVAFAVALAGVTYLDRICLSVLAPAIRRDLSLSRFQMSYVFSAFAIAYAAFGVPSAWLGERIGTRRVLAIIVCWWSVFTMAIAAATGYYSMLVIQFLFGVGEAGAWPNAAKTFSRWIPATERGRVQGIFFTGAFLVGSITPSLVTLLQPHLGWRGVFVCFGSLGLVWMVCWYKWFRDDPAEHSQVGPAELALITAGKPRGESHGTEGKSLRQLAGNSSAWALCLSYFSNSYGFYFTMSWLPTYLVERFGFQRELLAVFSGLPFLLSAFAGLLGGVITDFLSKRYGLRFGRCSVGVGGYLVAAVTMLLAGLEPQPKLGAALIAVAAASSTIPLASHWAAAIDIGREHAGVLSASMNTTGQIGSTLSPIVAAYLVEHYSNWALPLYVMSALYLFSSLCWLMVRPPAPAHS
jgi:MFS family permease